MPLIVIVLAAQVALVPDGKPFAAFTPSLLIPVASVVVWVIFVNDVFIHNVGLLEPTVEVFKGLTVTKISSVLVHPSSSVTVTVYIWLVTLLATGLLIMFELKFKLGLQLKLIPPQAFKRLLSYKQCDKSTPASAVGWFLTWTSTWSETTHPAPSVNVTV